MPESIADIKVKIRENLSDNAVTWYSDVSVTDSVQDSYNLFSALTRPINKTTFFPLIAGPHYALTDSIPDLYIIQGIYNPLTNLWLQYCSTTELSKERWDWERWNGTPCFWSPLSFRRQIIVPWDPDSSSALYLAYIARANQLTDADIPQIPESCISFIENYSTCDMLEQAREFKKAAMWFEKWQSNLTLAKQIVLDLARIHRNKVFEPWNTLGRYTGKGYNMTLVNNETPTGAINGINTTYTLAQIPNPSSSLSLYKNGVLLYQSVDYTLVGLTITLGSGSICSGTDSLLAFYQLA